MKRDFTKSNVVASLLSDTPFHQATKVETRKSGNTESRKKGSVEITDGEPAEKRSGVAVEGGNDGMRENRSSGIVKSRNSGMVENRNSGDTEDRNSGNEEVRKTKAKDRAPDNSSPAPAPVKKAIRKEFYFAPDLVEKIEGYALEEGETEVNVMRAILEEFFSRRKYEVSPVTRKMLAKRREKKAGKL